MASLSVLEGHSSKTLIDPEKRVRNVNCTALHASGSDNRHYVTDGLARTLQVLLIVQGTTFICVRELY
jgi:hypothetical protein